MAGHACFPLFSMRQVLVNTVPASIGVPLGTVTSDKTLAESGPHEGVFLQQRLPRPHALQFVPKEGHGVVHLPNPQEDILGRAQEDPEHDVAQEAEQGVELHDEPQEPREQTGRPHCCC